MLIFAVAFLWPCCGPTLYFSYYYIIDAISDSWILYNECFREFAYVNCCKPKWGGLVNVKKEFPCSFWQTIVSIQLCAIANDPKMHQKLKILVDLKNVPYKS